MSAKARNFDVTRFEAREMWHAIARSGEDTVAVARASYEAGGKVRHRLHAVAWLAFDARFSAEAREFAVELLDDRSRKVVEAAARALAWGWDVALLSRMRQAAARRSGAARADIEAAIAATEAGNPSFFLDRAGRGNLHMQVSDHDWREMRGGLVRGAQPRHIPTLLGIARGCSAPHASLVGRRPPLAEQDFRAAIAAKTCWITGAPITGYLVARQDRDWWIEDVAVIERAQDGALGWRLVAFAEEEGRRRGFGRIVLCTRANSGREHEAFARLGYRKADRPGGEGHDAAVFEKAL